MKLKQRKNNKVYLVLLFTFVRLNSDLEVEDCKVMTVHSTKEKAEERAEHLRKQFPDSNVSVIRKTLLGKL